VKSILKKWLAPLLSLKSNRGLKERSWLDVAGTLAVQKWLIGLGTALILSFLLTPSLAPPGREYRVRDIATKDVKASQDLLVEDERATQERRVEAERAVLSVYDFDPAVLSDAETRIRTAFETLAASSLNGKGNDQGARKRAEMESILRPPLTIREWGLLEKEHFNPALAEAAVGLLEPVLQKGIVSEKDLLDPDSIKGVAIWNIQTRSERTDILPTSSI
jgi:membrane-associated HD superfamily phosphohydrolase